MNDKLYPLDWKETNVELSRERFKHKLSRPDNSLLLEREKDLELEIPVNKKGNFKMPDSSFIEEIDANYYEKVKIEFLGYGDHEPPTLHKSKAFQGLFIRDIYIDEKCDVFGDQIRVIEEIGGDDEPEFSIVHIVKRPDDKELSKLRKIFNVGEYIPQRNGRKIFKTKSNLPSAMTAYSSLFVSIENATVNGEVFKKENREDFLNHINALTQRAVISCIVDELAENLLS